MLTPDEKAALVVMVSPGVPRLSIPVYNWWSEVQHGAGVFGTSPATSGPSTLTLAASWLPEAMRRMAGVAAVEARARHAAAVTAGIRNASQVSLTTFSPELNLVRHPLWGRAQESVGGEDPLLTAHMAAAYVYGLQQGDQDARVLLTSATCKDWLVYDWEGVGADVRNSANVTLTARDITETYVPTFLGCLLGGQAAAVMLTYYGIQLPGQPYAIPAVANAALVNGLLRAQLQWDGVVMSDCDAVQDMVTPRGFVPDNEHAAAAAIAAGTDLELNIVPGGCGHTGFAYSELPQAVTDGLVNMSVVDEAVYRLLRLRVRLGLFDPPTSVGYNALVNDSSNLLSTQHVGTVRTVA